MGGAGARESAWREINAALGSRASGMTAGGGSGANSEAPSRPVSASARAGGGSGLVGEPSPGGGARPSTGSAGDACARDVQKQMYEMQKVMVEVARRHNKLGDRVTKLEKGVKNRMDIQERLFIKLARQVDEMGRVGTTGQAVNGQAAAGNGSLRGAGAGGGGGESPAH